MRKNEGVANMHGIYGTLGVRLHACIPYMQTLPTSYLRRYPGMFRAVNLFMQSEEPELCSATLKIADGDDIRACEECLEQRDSVVNLDETSAKHLTDYLLAASDVQ